MVKLAVDAMGGDHGPSVTVPAAVKALKNKPDLEIILIGNEEQITDNLSQLRISEKIKGRLSVAHAEDEVLMTDSPTFALRRKKKSSMHIGAKLVKEKQVDGFVSGGNTGALMAISSLVLRTLPEIDRPAIIARFPTTKEECSVKLLDIGANVDSKPEHLLQFAIMATILTQEIDGIERPKVGIMNVGKELIKGNQLVKAASVLLDESDAINFIGNVEGNHLYNGDVDIIVCDGFVGNAIIKSNEGFGKFASQVLRGVFKRSILGRLIGLLAKPILRQAYNKLNPSRYNGAAFIGLQGVVVKSHGGAGKLAFRCAIETAYSAASHNIPELIAQEMQQETRENQIDESVQ